MHSRKRDICLRGDGFVLPLTLCNLLGPEVVGLIACAAGLDPSSSPRRMSGACGFGVRARALKVFPE